MKITTYNQLGACGITLYRGSVVFWDEDSDQRILSVIDNLIKEGYDVKGSCFSEHEGCLIILTDSIALSQVIEVDVDDGDCWPTTINE